MSRAVSSAPPDQPRAEIRQLPIVSVVVPALNAQAEVEDCLRSILAADYPVSRREVILVDNGSIDRTASIARELSVMTIREHRRGVGYARNRGIEACEGDLVAFTDPDCVATSRWLTEIVEAFDAPEVGAAGGPILPYPGSTPAERYAARRRSHAQERTLKHPYGPFFMAANLAVRRDALVGVGAFDVRFPGGGWEDADLCWRLARETGMKLRYAPAAPVFHRYRRTPREYLLQHHRYGYGLGLARAKHRAAFPWGARERARAYKELGASAGGLALAGARRCTGTSVDRDELAFRRLELLRQVGQRSGLLGAAVPGSRLLAPFRASTSRRGGG